MLSGLTIGNHALTPAFDPGVKSYTVQTSNATNKVTVTCDDADAEIVIALNGLTVIENGTAASWIAGENVLTITVSKNGAQTVYTVTVTKS